MGVPYGSTNSQVVTSATNLLLATGDIINFAAVMWIHREGIIVKIKMVDGTNFDQRFPTVAESDAWLQSFVQASSPAVIGAPYIQSITPATAVNSNPVEAVIRGQGFEPLGTVLIGADAATVTFVDSFTLLLSFVGTAPASTVNVTYTAPDLTTIATLTNGFVWT